MPEITENSNNEINVPEIYGRQKLNSLYRAIPLKDTTFRLLRKYFCAMKHLYKIIPLSKAKEIILSQNPGLVTDEEFLAFCEVARHENEGYYILSEDEVYIDGRAGGPLDRELIDRILIDCDEEDDENYYVKLKAQQSAKPYYIPGKKEFLEYSDMCYVEASPEKSALAKFLTESFGFEDEMLKNMIALISLTDVNDMNDVISIFEDFEIKVSEAQCKTFIPLYVDFMNNLRIPENRGYTPLELKSITPSSEELPNITVGDNMKRLIEKGEISPEELRRELIEADDLPDATRFGMLKQLSEIAPVEKDRKVGRNELCPCGSGKKYKKCCGR